MVVPVDDHMVHRGDAVFEAVKFVGGGVYALERHLERLQISAETIGLEIPESQSDLTAIILETVRASELQTGLVRLFVSRGPGDFTTNPYSTIGAQIYCAITTLKAPAAALYKNGCAVGRSTVAVKEGFFARTKTCNYLPNVMMKKEALDRGLDFVVSFDETGACAEGSTENFALIAEDGGLLIPPFARILRGVTMVRAFELAKEIGLQSESRSFNETDIRRAKGAMMLGTTLDLLPVRSYDDHIYAGIPDEARRLAKALASDIAAGPLRTAF